jgi:hypothetical protein
MIVQCSVHCDAHLGSVDSAHRPRSYAPALCNIALKAIGALLFKCVIAQTTVGAL